MDSLPLNKGALFVDNSFIESLDCPRLCEHRFLDRRVSASDKAGMNFGTAGHLVWALRYRKYGTKQPDDWLAARQAKLLEWYFKRHPQPEDDHRNLNWAVELFVKRYNERYAVEPFNLLVDKGGRPLVEMPFALHLFDFVGEYLPNLPKVLPIYYCGRIDLPIVRDNCIFVMDHKTTGLIGDRFWDKLRVAPQMHGYCWAFPQLVETKMQVAGFYVNAIRTSRQPAKPKNGLATWWEEALDRNCEYVRPDQIEEWRENTIALVSDFLFQYARGFLQQKKTQCVNFGRCEYYDVCRLPKAERQFALASPAFVDNTWTPLKRL